MRRFIIIREISEFNLRDLREIFTAKKMEIAKTPKPPYYAVIFSSLKNENTSGYNETSDRMVELAQQQPGYLGHESVREELGITVSYWQSLEDIKNWKKNSEHLFAQQQGREQWYRAYKTRICKVERDYEFAVANK